MYRAALLRGIVRIGTTRNHAVFELDPDTVEVMNWIGSASTAAG